MDFLFFVSVDVILTSTHCIDLKLSKKESLLAWPLIAPSSLSLKLYRQSCC
ncbi:hypothetical protein ALT785_240028 [Alteromonas infernus]